ncbi:aromatic amino acid transport family protein [Sansalvadorimonas verongulae]|uniref:aromatic amino acid transport family protein n=1 Tax=Sansalvadorimonas verongulae TaxID=2172824 RepID=UPI0012BCA243|nr:aromatic amino acid transport family protein [Sansalvadorimonas verongulae]MTI12386.1 amino acid transporter [Sansalvadorimonas verongulae]
MTETALETTVDVAQPEKRRSILGGTMIVAGTAIGAGMFSIPVATSGMWFGYSILLMLFSWFCMYSAALYLLEANLRFPKGASFDSIAQGTLGTGGRLINTACIGFLLYIILYAYISGGSSVIISTMKSFTSASISQGTASLLFSVVLSAIVLVGTKAVDRITTALMGGMIVSFAMSAHGLVSHAQVQSLFPSLPTSDVLKYSLGAFSVVALSFAMQNTVPSLTKYYDKDEKKVRSALLFGSLITLAIYVIWQAAIFGNLDRGRFPGIIAAGGNIGTLLDALAGADLSSNAANLVTLFSNMAIASSFLGVALSLFEFINDMFGFGDSTAGRIKTAAVTFVPPTALGILLPNGFITAIGYAGLMVTITFILTPVLMAMKGRKDGAEGYRVPGGSVRLYLILAFGIFSVLIATLDIFGILPAFGH